MRVITELRSFSFTHIHLLRRAFRIALAVFLATWITHYFSRTEEYWIVISSLMVMKTSLGAPLREHLIRFIIILFCALFSSVVLVAVSNEIIFYVLVLLVFLVIWGLLAVSYELEPHILCPPLMMAALLLVAMLAPYDPASVIYDRVHDIIMGAFVGTLVGLTVFPERIEMIFRKNVFDILTLFSTFFSMLMTKLVRQDEFNATEESKLMAMMLKLACITPSWVYHSAFNPGLRKSYRYFLSVVMQISDALFSLHYLSSSFHDVLPPLLAEAIMSYAKTTQQLFDLIISRLGDEALLVDFFSNDFVRDVTELERSLQDTFPTSLEFLSISKEAVTLTMLVRDLKELRMALVRVAESIG